MWSRNIKNGCSIYIYDISRLRVNIKQYAWTWNLYTQIYFESWSTRIKKSNLVILKRYQHDLPWISSKQQGVTNTAITNFIKLYVASTTLPLCTYSKLLVCIYTGCPRRSVPDFGRVFLMLKYTDINQNTYAQSWTVTEIMAREKCGLLAGPRTAPVSWQVLSMFILECGVRLRKVISH